MTAEGTAAGAAETLRRGGIANPSRLAKLIRDAIAFLRLDLSGLTVLTEAASGPFVVTPVIAALAGAERVLALTRDSRYGSVAEVIAQTRALDALCGVRRAAEIYPGRPAELFAQADIVTNLGFVRPLDAEAVAAMKPTAVIPLMCEAWEFRPGDVALDEARRKGIQVLGTNEDYPGLEVFAYSGWLCLKMLFEAQVEVHKSRLVVVGSDKFGRVIERLLARAGARVQLLPELSRSVSASLAGIDALIVADYTRTETIIGPSGDLTAAELARLAEGVTVIQFAGRVDIQSLAEQGIFTYPGAYLDSRRMAQTLAALGPRPVVELHTAGLKVGEMAARGRTPPADPAGGQPSLMQAVRPAAD